MAKVIITIEDVDSHHIKYNSECDNMTETNENGEPTLAIQAASNLISHLLDLSGNVNVEFNK